MINLSGNLDTTNAGAGDGAAITINSGGNNDEGELAAGGATVLLRTRGAGGDDDVTVDVAFNDSANDDSLEIDAGNGTVSIDRPIGTISALDYVLLSAADTLTSAAAPIDLSGQPLYLDAAGYTVVVQRDVTVGAFVFYRGTLDLGTNAVTLTSNDDFVVFGPSYDAQDADRTGSSPTNAFFRYPEPSSLAAYTPTAFAGIDDPDNGSQPAPAGDWAQFSDLAPSAAGSPITVSGDFYVNGTNMTGTYDWDLAIPDNSSVAGLDGTPVSLSFGSPYAVAFNMNVSHSQAAPGWVNAASSIVGPPAETNNAVGDNGSNSQWQFERPEIRAAATVYDNVIRVTMEDSSGTLLQIENDDNEIWEAVQDAVSGPNGGNIWADGGTLRFAETYADADAQTTTTGEGDLSEFYIRTTAGTWNTDADGGNGGDALSTDRSGAHQTVVPDLQFLKGVLFAADGKTMVRNYGPNGFGGFTATTDETRPVLVGVVAGRAPHERSTADSSKEPYDGHNFFRLYYSEPVDFGGLTADPSDLSADNQRAQSSFGVGEWGGHFTETTSSSVGTSGPDTGGVVEVVGYFDFAGSLLTGSRDGTAATNSLFRTSPENPYGEHGLSIYAVGYSFMDGSNRVWPGYMFGNSRAGGTGGTDQGRPGNYPYNVSDPVNQAANAVSNPNITDAQGNPVEPAAGVPYDGVDAFSQKLIPQIYDGTLGDPPPNLSAPATDPLQPSELPGWDHEAPGFSTFSDPPNESREIVSRINPLNNKINRLEFYIQDNFVSDDPPWDPQTDPTLYHVDPDTTHGVRDISFSFPDAVSEIDGFQAEEIGVTPVNTYNIALATDTNNFLFSDTGDPQNVNVQDDPYFGLTVDDGAHNWSNLTDLWFRYDSSNAFLTDLAGNLLPSTPAGDDFNLNVIERVPPSIDLSLIRVGTDSAFVRFSEPVYGNQSGDTQVTASQFVLTEDGAPASIQIDSIDPITLDSGGVLEATFNLSGAIDANFAIDGRIEVAGADTVYDNLQNPMLPDVPYRISDIGIGIAEPVLATDRLRSYGDFGEDFTTIRDFTGAGTGLVPGQIRLQAQINADEHTDDLLRMYYDVAPSEEALVEDEEATDFWLPTVVPGYNLITNSEARSLLPYQRNGNGDLRTFQIPEDDEITEGVDIEFVLRVGDLYAARLSNPDNVRSLAPYLIPMRGIIDQRSGVTILNNVINPTAGEKAYLTYELPESGVVRVVVFTVNGDVVRVFHSGRQAAGSYTYAWDGTNERGNPVARGVYFVRVVGPDFDEYRKVMVVK